MAADARQADPSGRQADPSRRQADPSRRQADTNAVICAIVDEMIEQVINQVIFNGSPIVFNDEEKVLALATIPFKNFIDYYSLGRRLEVGRYSSVHKCKIKREHLSWVNPSLQNKFVVKIMEHKYFDLFAREHQTFNKIGTHPLIVNRIEYFQDHAYLYGIFEYVSNMDLFYFISTVETNMFQIHEIFTQLVLAVEFIHKNNYVHGDLKPENIMIILTSEAPKIKLIDFGLSFKKRIFKHNFGTFDYMSPEMQLREECDERIDIWSLGVILYELFFKQTPFVAKTKDQIRENIIAGKFSYPFEIPPEIKDLIDRMLKPKDQRISLKEIKNHVFFG